jgi:hypothetical protein
MHYQTPTYATLQEDRLECCKLGELQAPHHLCEYVCEYVCVYVYTFIYTFMSHSLAHTHTHTCLMK